MIRAIGAGFTSASQPNLQEAVRQWLMSLLQDPSEKVRRYAMNALPKIGAGRAEERQLLELLQKSDIDRERKFLGQALNKIGGSATLDVIRNQGGRLSHLTEQRAKANLARQQKPSSIRLDAALPHTPSLRIHLRCRAGLESILAREIKDTTHKFSILDVLPGLLILAPTSPFQLNELYSLRIFSTASILLGTLPKTGDRTEALARLIASPLNQQLCRTFTHGPVRYRLEFVTQGHQRSAILQAIQKVYALCPDLLNDSRQAPWSIEVHPGFAGDWVELRPRLSPDPRFPYRQQDVPAASHPPLAAAMARLAGSQRDETIWDPFCGSGLELIERTRLGGVRAVLGTDLSSAAIEAAQANWHAARLDGVRVRFIQKDFRDFLEISGCTPGSISLIITNPPLGKRVPVPNLRELLQELFTLASLALRPGGRMVWVNPLRMKASDPTLHTEYQQTVDLGGFACRLELLRKH
ncbi:MAG: methyltransferase domain-containing protein [Verrucomicrobia bacterium]|nr:methyltransferase domain-containing protein [Verrucomicrobiota bacterium]